MKYEQDFIITCKKIGKRIKIERINKYISINEYRIRLLKHLLKIASALKLDLFELFTFE